MIGFQHCGEFLGSKSQELLSSELHDDCGYFVTMDIAKKLDNKLLLLKKQEVEQEFSFFFHPFFFS